MIRINHDRYYCNVFYFNASGVHRLSADHYPFSLCPQHNPQTDADQDRAVAPPHCWHRLADSSVPSDQSGAHRPMRVCIHKAAHGFCMENFDKLPIHTLHPQHLAISIKTSSFESLRRVLSLIHFPRWNAFLIMSFQHSKSSVSHDNFAKTYLFTSYLRS